MASKNENTVQAFVKGQLEEAQGLVRGLIELGKAQGKELEGLLGRVPRELDLKVLEKKANQAGTQVKKRLDVLQSRVVEAAGVASQAQLRELSRELTRISKKLDAVVSKKSVSRS
jgi:hypothetical protein